MDRVAPLAFVGLLLVAPAPGLAQTSKESNHTQMLSLAAQMRQLKPQIGTSTAAAASYEAAAAQYRALSRQMGGDDPGQVMGPDGGAGAAAPAAPQVAPPAPLNCTAATVTFTQSTPVAIPTGPAVVTSTVVVAGVGPFLWDLDLTTNLTHTFAADLDITLTSPAGTVVTLTTDNGAGNDNVFNGTLWDDDANPAGVVPYVTNNGVATDHAYVNLTTATPLVAEEAMGAFLGENPNGTWTITISDDLAGDGGSLASWSLGVTTLAAAPTLSSATLHSSAGAVAIPTGPAVATSAIAVAGAGTISDIQVTTNITHTFAADLDITLTSPAGTVVTLTTDNGAGNDNVFNGTIWRDDANPAGTVPYVTNNGLVTDHAYVNLTLASPLVPEEALSAFLGENPNGTWTLTVSDDLAGDGGSIDSWSITIVNQSCGCALTCPANIAVSNDPAQCGAVVNYPAPTTSGSCGTVTCSPASGSFYPVGATPITCNGTGAQCSFSITVNDVEAPTLTCPADIFTDVPPGSQSTTVDFPPPGVSDNCPGVGAPTCAPASGDPFLLGATVVACTASDAAGNDGNCAFDVTVGALSIQEIPAASTLGLLALALLLGGAAVVALRRGA
jgi:subtilisin-like proprotein convertase family protein